MNKKKEAIFEAAAALPEPQRVRLIRRLLDTLADPGNFWEQQLADELDRRHNEVKDGTAKLISWAELKKQLKH